MDTTAEDIGLQAVMVVLATSASSDHSSEGLHTPAGQDDCQFGRDWSIVLSSPQSLKSDCLNPPPFVKLPPTMRSAVAAQSMCLWTISQHRRRTGEKSPSNRKSNETIKPRGIAVAHLHHTL